jgi:hypothetical protein
MPEPKLDIDVLSGDAELVATFYRLLRRSGVPASAAIVFASKYLEVTMLTRAAGELPREPWEEGR